MFHFNENVSGSFYSKINQLLLALLLRFLTVVAVASLSLFLLATALFRLIFASAALSLALLLIPAALFGLFFAPAALSLALFSFGGLLGFVRLLSLLAGNLSRLFNLLLVSGGFFGFVLLRVLFRILCGLFFYN